MSNTFNTFSELKPERFKTLFISGFAKMMVCFVGCSKNKKKVCSVLRSIKLMPFSHVARKFEGCFKMVIRARPQGCVKKKKDSVTKWLRFGTHPLTVPAHAHLSSYFYFFYFFFKPRPEPQLCV